MRIKKIFDRY